MAVDPRWSSPEWKELAKHLHEARVLRVQQGSEPDETEDHEATLMLRAIPELLGELDKLQQLGRSFDAVNLLREMAKEVERLRPAIAALASAVSGKDLP